MDCHKLQFTKCGIRLYTGATLFHILNLCSVPRQEMQLGRMQHENKFFVRNDEPARCDGDQPTRRLSWCSRNTSTNLNSASVWIDSPA